MREQQYAASLLVLEWNTDEANRFRNEIEAMGVRTISCAQGLTMQSLQDSFGTSFHLGEVLTTECRVEWMGVSGWSMVMGSHNNHAYLAAAMDMMERVRELPKPMAHWLQTSICELSQRRIKKLAQQWDCVRSTKVNFGLMVEG